jgi:hypothetical protein
MYISYLTFTENKKFYSNLRTALFQVITQRVVVIYYRSFGTTYRVPSFYCFWILDPLKIGKIDCPETSVINYHYSLHKNPESAVLIYFAVEDWIHSNFSKNSKHCDLVMLVNTEQKICTKSSDKLGPSNLTLDLYILCHDLKRRGCLFVEVMSWGCSCKNSSLNWHKEWVAKVVCCRTRRGHLLD